MVLVSWHSFLRARLAVAPSAADHCPVQTDPECTARRLHQHRSQVTVSSSLLDVQLRLAHTRVFCAQDAVPQKHPASRLRRNRCGSSRVRTKVNAISVPTPFTCLSRATWGIDFRGDLLLDPPVIFPGCARSAIRFLPNSGSKASRQLLTQPLWRSPDSFVGCHIFCSRSP